MRFETIINIIRNDLVPGMVIPEWIPGFRHHVLHLRSTGEAVGVKEGSWYLDHYHHRCCYCPACARLHQLQMGYCKHFGFYPALVPQCYRYEWDLELQ